MDQQPKMDYSEQVFGNSLVARQPSKPISRSDVARILYDIGIQNKGQQAAPQQHDVRMSYGRMGQQPSLHPTAAPVEANPDNGTIT
jgi:hypothetical protein